MIIAGQNSSGQRQCISQTGDIIDEDVVAKKTYLGVCTDQIKSKRLWVDSSLSDSERVLFIKNSFKEISYSSVDYEIIDHDAGRDLLHGFAFLHKISQRNIAAVETDLHGLGRAIEWYHAPSGAYQCISIFENSICLSVHNNKTLYFFVTLRYISKQEAIFAVRRAMEHYYVSQPINLGHCYLINFCQKQGLNIHTKIHFDAPLTVVDGRHGWIIAYGLARRGLDD
jgi:hypothetical protein